MIDIQDIQSLTDFQRNTREHIRRLGKTGRPEVLTVNGRPKLVVQDARSYREMAAKIARYDDWLAVQKGLDDIEAGKVRPMDEVFDELDTKYFGKPLVRHRKK